MVRNGLGLETELRLGLPGGGGAGGCEVERNEKKRVFSDIFGGGGEEEEEEKVVAAAESENLVVGWPPVAAYRRKNSFGRARMYVKVSMDGAPYLRKIDLSSHKRYSDLAAALEELYGRFGIGGDQLKDGDKYEYIPIYEDKDGDWMLVGDVPWGMFVESCRRLRIMKKSDDAKRIAEEVEN